MRGLSFSATALRRSTDRPSTPTSSSTAPSTASASLTPSPPTKLKPKPKPRPKSLIKRLSATLRRRPSPNHARAPTQISHTTATNKNPNAPAPRAHTFSVGEPIPHLYNIAPPPIPPLPPTATTTTSPPEIPFFTHPNLPQAPRPDRPPRPAPAPTSPTSPATSPRPVAVVRGRPPAWTPAPTPVSQNAPTSPVLSESINKNTDSQLVPHPAHAQSFTVAEHATRPSATSALLEPRARSMSVPQPGNSRRLEAGPGQIVRRVRPAREQGKIRWPLPPGEDCAHPRLFVPPSGTPLDRVTARRDRTEARALVSACTFLEAEVERMRQFEQEACACENACACGQFLGESLKRLVGVLGILEDRYESIEQVYVKSEEYAIAMGRFFEVSPQVINKLAAGHRDLAGRGDKDKSKGLR